jgi:para-nitrobenzyl esterase
MKKRYGSVLLVLILVGCGKQTILLDTPQGPVQGYLENNSHSYLGIPYARPPVGDLRWRPPQPIAAWEAVLDATELAQSCPQFAPPFNVLMGEEDCLYLNVWIPENRPKQPMPVMVWIHGGGFTAGKAAYSEADGQRLAAQTGSVVVAMNYRLGVFGFLAHQALTGEDASHPTSGNYGIEDQTAALRWVRDNIAAFGGDPGNVTIFGQSAGGVSVCAQLASPSSAGLFHRAVIQSGPCDTPMSTLSAVSELGSKLSRALACDSADDELKCLRDKPAKQVADILPPDPSFAFGEGYTLWWPVLDGKVLPMQFQQAFVSGRFSQVPVINGATLDEGSLIVWLSHNFLFKPLKADQYLDRLEYLVGSRSEAELVAAQYPLENYASPFEALTEAFSDGFFNCMSRSTSAALARYVPVWAYQFDYQDAPFFIPGAKLKAFHSAEIQYIFGQPMSLTQSEFEGEQVELADAMMGYWSQFAASGDPNREDLPRWPVFADGDQTQLFDAQIVAARDVHRAQCRFWDRIDYKRAAYQ